MLDALFWSQKINQHGNTTEILKLLLCPLSAFSCLKLCVWHFLSGQHIGFVPRIWSKNNAEIKLRDLIANELQLEIALRPHTSLKSISLLLHQQKALKRALCQISETDFKTVDLAGPKSMNFHRKIGVSNRWESVLLLLV